MTADGIAFPFGGGRKSSENNNTINVNGAASMMHHQFIIEYRFLDISLAQYALAISRYLITMMMKNTTPAAARNKFQRSCLFFYPLAYSPSNLLWSVYHAARIFTLYTPLRERDEENSTQSKMKDRDIANSNDIDTHGQQGGIIRPRNAKNSSDEVGRKCHQSSTPQVVGIDKVSLLMRPDYLDPR